MLLLLWRKKHISPNYKSQKSKGNVKYSSFALTIPYVIPRSGIDSFVLEKFYLYSGFYFRVLFDMGASHSFVSKDLVLRRRQFVC